MLLPGSSGGLRAGRVECHRALEGGRPHLAREFQWPADRAGIDGRVGRFLDDPADLMQPLVAACCLCDNRQMIVTTPFA